jgi:hypothetical protein
MIHVLALLADSGLEKAPWWIGLPVSIIVIGAVAYLWLTGTIMRRADHVELMAAEKARGDGYATAYENTAQALAISERNNASLIESSKTTVSLIEALRESMGHPR